MLTLTFLGGFILGIMVGHKHPTFVSWLFERLKRRKNNFTKPKE